MFRVPGVPSAPIASECPSRRQNRAAKRRAAGEVESIKIKDHSLESFLSTAAPLKSDEPTGRQGENRGLPHFPTPCNNTLQQHLASGWSTATMMTTTTTTAPSSPSAQCIRLLISLASFVPGRLRRPDARARGASPDSPSISSSVSDACHVWQTTTGRTGRV